MVVCPHCGELGVDLLSRAWSDSASAVRCKKCGGYSYMPSRYKFVLSLLANIGFVLAAISAIYFKSIFPLIIFVACWLFAYAMVARLVEGVAVSKEQAKTQSRNGSIFLILVVSVSIVVAFWVNRANASNKAFKPFATLTGAPSGSAVQD